ncbi:MAG: phosphate ABC transporter permease PstA [Anaerolineaceae bacterium]|nr:phosphate ABC transporter permease PstA [Anaerolineaceae bacterium]
MQLSTRKLLDRSFSGLGILSILFMGATLAIILTPIVTRGSTAFVFRGTVEHRRYLLTRHNRGDADQLKAELDQVAKARRPVFKALKDFEKELESMPAARYRELSGPYDQVKSGIIKLLGPLPGTKPRSDLTRDSYGQRRWDRTQVVLKKILNEERWVLNPETGWQEKQLVPRAERFKGTRLEGLFAYVEQQAEAMLLPRWTFYWGFLTDNPEDDSMFGGIWPALLGTIYLTIGAMLFAVPMGVITAVYLVEYAPADSRMVSVLRIFISTLAGVPSIVFGLFGLAFFIYRLHVSESKSVLAGALTLALLVLPTVIRAAEEAVRSVPRTYKQAALSLGATQWRTVATVVLPAALPGILTGIIISMGRAAGETAPIIFTAAVSWGRPLGLGQLLDEGTPALPWNIYNLCTEHEAVEEIRYMQFGMVLVLISLVLLLNVTAIVLRARIAKKLRG